MYFSMIPDLKYDTKPISYPFSESDYVTAKNFFRRYKIDEDIFGYATFYNRYALQDNIKLETIAKEYYGNPFYDWVIVLTNNMINPQFSLPQTSEVVRKIAEEKYGETEAYSGIHHYETIRLVSEQTVDGFPVIILADGLIVDHNFYTSDYTYWNGDTAVTVSGNTVAKPITNYEYEVNENEKKREVYILKEAFFPRFLNEFKTRNLYKESSDFITKRLKKTAV